MRRNNDGVAPFYGKNRLNHRRRFGVSAGCQGADHADGLGDFNNIALAVLFDHTHGFVVQNIEQGCPRFLGDF